MHVLFHWLHPGWSRHVCMDRLYKRSKFQLNRWKTDGLLGVKVSDIPYQLWTAGLSLMRPSLIGMKLVPDERSGPMTPSGQVPKISYRPFFRVMAPESWYLLMFDPNVKSFVTRHIPQNFPYLPKIRPLKWLRSQPEVLETEKDRSFLVLNADIFHTTLFILVHWYKVNLFA